MVNIITLSLWSTSTTSRLSFLHHVLGGIVSLVARVPILPVDEVTTDFMQTSSTRWSWSPEQWYGTKIESSYGGNVVLPRRFPRYFWTAKTGYRRQEYCRY